MYYKNELVDSYDLKDQPHEIVQRQRKLYTNIMKKIGEYGEKTFNNLKANSHKWRSVNIIGIEKNS